MVEKAGSDTVRPISDEFHRKIVGLMQSSALRPLQITMLDSKPMLIRFAHGEKWLGSLTESDFNGQSVHEILETLGIPRSNA